MTFGDEQFHFEQANPLTEDEQAELLAKTAAVYHDALALERYVNERQRIRPEMPDKALIQVTQTTTILNHLKTLLGLSETDLLRYKWAWTTWTPNQLHKYLWRQYDYESRIHELDVCERDDLKAIYTRLSYLSQTDRNFIMQHYHHPKGERVTDTIMAKKLGMTMADYRKQRVAIESKLLPAKQYPKGYQSKSVATNP